MSGGVIAVACLVSALVFVETIAPRLLAALRHALRKAKAAREAAARADADPRTVAVSATGVVTYAPSEASSEGGAMRAVAPLESAGRRGPAERSETAEGRDSTDLESVGRRDANRLWEEARTMTHRFKPDWEKDQDYLAKIYAAARLGHLEAMTKLGEYASRRGAVVEAFYWTLLAELKGATGLKVKLRELRSRWQSLGCPGQYRNASTDFTEEQGAFARAVLRLQCGIDPQYARARLKKLADRGVEEARLFLGKLRPAHQKRPPC